MIFDAMRPVILTGIEELATRNDLLDRAVLLTLPTIPEDKRRPEAEFWAAFDAAAPSILGALLPAVSDAMRRLPAVKLPRLPRMADFALWATPGDATLAGATQAVPYALHPDQQFLAERHRALVSGHHYRRRIRRGVFQGVEQLERAIREYIDYHNANPQGFAWTAKEQVVLEKIRTHAELNNVPSA